MAVIIIEIWIVYYSNNQDYIPELYSSKEKAMEAYLQILLAYRRAGYDVQTTSSSKDQFAVAKKVDENVVIFGFEKRDVH